MAISSSSLPIDPAARRPRVVSVNCRSNIDSAAPSSRSTWPGVGGSTFTSRHRASSALRSRSRDISTRQMSPASHTISVSSSPTAGSRNPWYSRICLRWFFTWREVKSYSANSAGATFT